MDKVSINPLEIDNNSDNPRSKEEEEELEEQKRRQKELDCLLSDGIQAFTFEDNSPNTTYVSSACSSFHEANNYREAMAQDQLKVLYDVRVREINSLKEEFNKYKNEKEEEVKLLKNKLILSEADMRQLKLSMANMESLLIEKTETIRTLKEDLNEKEVIIKNMEKQLDENEVDICSFKTALNDLHLKQAEDIPAHAISKSFQSGELQKALQQQINRLELLLEEEANKTRVLEKENAELNKNFKTLLQNKQEEDEENKILIADLTAKLQAAQQQCKDLFLLGDALKKESDHFKERLRQLESNSSFEVYSGKGSMDKETMAKHMERLKRITLDKDTELNTLKQKLKFYDSDVREFFEYQKMFLEQEIQSCGVKEHKNQLIFYQKEIENLKSLVEDRNQQIMNLELVNKDLQEKIEEMLQQTRNEIQNLSHKYNLPQLEKMSNELKEAEEKIRSLEKKLEEVENERNSLLQQKINNKNINEEQEEGEGSALLKKIVEDLKEDKVKLRKLTKRYEEKIQELEASHKKQEENLKGNYNNLLKAKNDLEEEKNELEERLKLSQKELELTKKHLEMERKYERELNDFDKVINRLENEIKTYKESLKFVEEGKALLNEQLEESKKQISALQLKIKMLEKNESTNNEQLQSEILNKEIKLRDELREEYQTELKKIEETYQKAIMQKSKNIEKLKEQEIKYKNSLGTVIEQCGMKVSQMENEIEKLKSLNTRIGKEYDEYKKNTLILEEQYKKALFKVTNDYEIVEEKFKKALDEFGIAFKKNQRLNQNRLGSVLSKMNTNQEKYVAIQKAYDKKIKILDSKSF